MNTKLDAFGIKTDGLGKATFEVSTLNTSGTCGTSSTVTKHLPFPFVPKSVKLKNKKKKKLISLVKWNEKQSQPIISEPRVNGIACPSCGEELVDSGSFWSNNNGTFIDVGCTSCGFYGERRS